MFVPAPYLIAVVKINFRNPGEVLFGIAATEGVTYEKTATSIPIISLVVE